MKKKTYINKSVAIVIMTALLLASSVQTYASEVDISSEKNALVADSSEFPLSTQENLQAFGGAFISDDSYIDAEDLQREPVILPTQPRTTWYILPGTVYRYEQLDPYYCVPATMQTILRYNNDTTPPSQDTIATAMDFQSGVGTDFLLVSSYLNANQSKHTYILHSKSSLSNMTTRISADIAYYVVPTCVRISVSNSADWFYTTSGHALVCNSITTDNANVQLVDPGVGYSWYTKTSSELYAVFTHLAW